MNKSMKWGMSLLHNWIHCHSYNSKSNLIGLIGVINAMSTSLLSSSKENKNHSSTMFKMTMDANREQSKGSKVHGELCKAMLGKQNICRNNIEDYIYKYIYVYIYIFSLGHTLTVKQQVQLPLPPTAMDQRSYVCNF